MILFIKTGELNRTTSRRNHNGKMNNSRYVQYCTGHSSFLNEDSLLLNTAIPFKLVFKQSDFFQPDFEEWLYALSLSGERLTIWKPMVLNGKTDGYDYECLGR
jgi:hypothetical protein